MLSHILYRLFLWSSSKSTASWISYSKAITLVSLALFMRLRYALVRRRLWRIAAHRKLRVVFVIGDECKWKCQLVYEAMLQSDHYDPYIAPTVMDLGWIDDKLQPERYRKCREFFVQKNDRVLDVCDIVDGVARPRPLAEFKPDIVIYQQPWGIAEEQAPIAVSRYALTFYMPYYIVGTGEQWGLHKAPIFRILYGHFIESIDFVNYFKSKQGRWHVGSTMFPCGNPFREEIWRARDNREQEDCVIYAPHWSFENAEGTNRKGWSTFLKTGEEMLCFAKQHPEIHWIFKPHPMLRIKLEERKVWPLEKIAQYYRDWETLGEAYYSGNYIPLFYRSRALITDCISFLTEYLILDRPLIRLEPAKPPAIIEPARRKFDAMYRVNNHEELKKVFDTVILGHQDPMKEKRHQVISSIGLDKNDISQQVIQILNQEMGIQSAL